MSATAAVSLKSEGGKRRFGATRPSTFGLQIKDEKGANTCASASLFGETGEGVIGTRKPVPANEDSRFPFFLVVVDVSFFVFFKRALFFVFCLIFLQKEPAGLEYSGCRSMKTQ